MSITETKNSSSLDVKPAPFRLVYMADFDYWGIDSFFSIIPVLILAFFFAFFTSFPESLLGWIIMAPISLFVLLPTSILTRAFLINRYGETPGIRLIGIKIISKSTGSLPTFSQALKREVFKFFAYFPHFPFVALMPDGPVETKHDLSAGTRAILVGGQTKEKVNRFFASDTYNILLAVAVFITVLAFFIYYLLTRKSWHY